jgi:hypothetical protein
MHARLTGRPGCSTAQHANRVGGASPSGLETVLNEPFEGIIRTTMGKKATKHHAGEDIKFHKAMQIKNK